MNKVPPQIFVTTSSFSFFFFLQLINEYKSDVIWWRKAIYLKGFLNAITITIDFILGYFLKYRIKNLSFYFSLFFSIFFLSSLFRSASCSLQFTRISLPLVNSILAILQKRNISKCSNLVKSLCSLLFFLGFMETILGILSQFYQRARFNNFICYTIDSFISSESFFLCFKKHKFSL